LTIAHVQRPSACIQRIWLENSTAVTSGQSVSTFGNCESNSLPAAFHFGYPLSEIALAAGFFDQSHFSKTFKHINGMSPATYRRTFRPRDNFILESQIQKR